MTELRGKRALVMGLGVHGGGLGVARFLAGQGADVTVTDLRGPDLLRSSLDALADLPIRFVLGEHRDADFQSAELVVRNPGVPRESRFLQIARAAGAQIEMEMTLFFRLCPGPILGVTGTKGKTTTTTLVGAMLREQFPQTVVAGNLRVSALEQLPAITAGTPVVLELSSFVLEGLGEAGLSPRYAAVTNLSADHLDRYGSMESYAEAKRQIVAHQDADGLAVLNGSDPRVRVFAGATAGRVHFFYAGEPPAGDRGRIERGEIDATVVGPDAIRTTAGAAPGEWRTVCRTGDVPLIGRHNLLNVAAASALAAGFGVEHAALLRAVRGFKGVADRMEPVRLLDGVTYINDTTATAPEAAIAALESLDAPIVLLAGGADKNLPFDALAAAIRRRARALVLLAGTATPKLQAALSAVEGPQLAQHGPFDDFAVAIGQAQSLARPGDVVLLSPGCASFGMFRNEFHRGEEFRRIVTGL
ncbi:MAG TPA: UDP-N-acetylmuramoyl-L-alanine--D-glutamate ligase [Roseiflexaceae bacterium]|nr:UDP-N-acetylmuramoyl-L-alanine--D-glutamate ligase [Roseiflexaceae bacterium]